MRLDTDGGPFGQRMLLGAGLLLHTLHSTFAGENWRMHVPAIRVWIPVWLRNGKAEVQGGGID